MPTTLPVTFIASPLPSDFKGTPQEFLDALVARLAIISQDENAFFVSGSVAPTSNQGPWLKDGITWYVWDINTGAYVPQVIAQASLRYVASQTSPDPNLYDLWIKINPSQEAIDLLWYARAPTLQWESIFDKQIAPYSTTVAMNAAIAAAVSASAIKYPFRGDSAADQDVVFAAPGTQAVDIVFSETYDPNSVFGSSVFTAPINGIYAIQAKAHLDCPSGAPTGNGLILALKKSGSVMGNEQVFFPDSGTEGRTMDVTTQLALNAGDQIGLNMNFTITGGTGTWRVSANNTFLSGSLIQAT